jgi:arylformamidase
MMIYKQYDQAELNRQYDNRLQVPEHASHVEKWERLSRETRQEYFPVTDIEYGMLSREKLDIYPSPKPGSKTLVFIHGGYWRNMDKSLFHFVAKAFIDYDITIVIITYPLTPEVLIDQVVLSCRKAIRWVYENIMLYNGDPGQICIAGHSAGGHLAAMMMTEDKQVRPVPLKGVCSMSGLFNLIPIRLSEVNETLQMDNATALQNSPVQLEPAVTCSLILSVGGDETVEYLEQSEELYHSWKQKLPVQLLSLKGLNHYSIIEDMLDANSVLHQKMLELMNV